MKLPLMGGVGPAAETSSHLTAPSSGESIANLTFAGVSDHPLAAKWKHNIDKHYLMIAAGFY